MIGQTLDRYTIESKLGEGGMGVVYRARDSHLNRAVAIKVLPADKVSDPERRARFAQEARAASALNHPNIVTIHDIRADAGTDFIVMELVSGRPLDTVIGGRPLRVDRALRYAIQIADALARAHEAGIVHRDLKPSNIVVSDDDVVKVLDFGLAKLVDPAALAAELRTQTTPLTEAGMIVGTAAYMSPEQAEGRKIDGRSDIFSFGAILYEMTTGRRAFQGSSALSVLAKILNEEPPPPSSVGAVIPGDVERTILRCLRKDPARRFQTMADLKVALEDLAEESGKMPAAAGPAARRGWRIPAVVALLFVVATAAGYGLWRVLRERAPAPSTGAPQPAPLTALPGSVRYPTFSPDGNNVAFTWNGPRQDNVDLYVQQIGAGDPLRLTTDPAIDFSPMWSPDGRAIAFLRPQPDGGIDLRLIAPLGGPERKLAEVKPRGFLREPTIDWCADSSCIILTDHTAPSPQKPDALFVVSRESGEKRQLTAPPDNILADTDPAVSPDGKWLVFRRDVAPFSGRLHIAPLAAGMTVSGEARPLTTILLTAYGPRWISNDEIVFSAKGALWRMHIAPGSTPERVAFAGEYGLTPAVWRSERVGASRLAYVRSYRDLNIWRITTPGAGLPANGAPAAVIASTRIDAVPQLAPDGKRVAFLSDRDGEWEVWTSEVDGSNAVRLTSLAANPGYPRWSPDGSLIAFHSNAEDEADGNVHLVPAGGGKVRRLTSGSTTNTFPSFSRDGQWVYFRSRRSGTFGIWKVPVAGGTPVQVPSRGGSSITIEGEDGNLYFVESSGNNVAGPLWQQPATGGQPVRILESAFPAAFDVVERGLYYFDAGASDTLKFYDFKTRRTSVIAAKLGPVNVGLTVSRDGRTILYTRLDARIDDLMLVDRFR